MKSRYPDVRRQCDEASLELRFYLAPKQTIFSILLRIGRNLITYENALPRKKMALITESKVKYVEDVIVKRETANLGMSRKEVIQVISDIGQEKFFVQAYNHLVYLILVKRLTHFKRLGRVGKYQTTTIERSQICVPQQYR